MIRFVFISSPYTVGDKLKNVETSIGAAETLSSLGYIPMLPLLSHYWDEIYPHEYEFWMNLCLDWLTRCDAILRLPGFSKGADREIELAHKLGIPVFEDIDSFLEYNK